MKLSQWWALPFVTWLLFLNPAVAMGLETEYTLEIEARGYTQDSPDPSRINSSYALSFEPEFKNGFSGNNTIVTFTPFGRWDSKDEERRHADIRELNVLHVSGSWETLVGVSKVFWGVTESSHLVDVINQTDYLEGFDGEDKLGQPMLRLSRAFDQNTVTVFALPGFRERAFLSTNNPLALPFPVNNEPTYESSDGDNHVDYSVRFSGYRDIVDYGLSWFHGTSRDPDFIPGDDGRLVPFYAQIDQLGLDLQVTSGAWLWKLETIRREFSNNNVISGDDFTAAVGGFEYSIYSMVDGLFDLGLLAEYHTDSRDDPATVTFQNDLFLGMRFGFNDAEGSEILAGTFIDQDDQTSSFRVEANRRIFTNARISLEAQSFSNVDPDNAIYSLSNSDFVLLSLDLYF